MADGAAVVVSDATPLISLARIARLQLLEALFSRVIVPRAVWREAVEDPGEGAPGVAAIRAAGWISVVQVAAVDASLASLGEGEAEAIALGAAIPGVLLLMDDAAGRAAATARGLPVLGTLGVARRAKRAGLVPAVRPLIDDLARSGFRASTRLVDAILADVGELDD